MTSCDKGIQNYFSFSFSVIEPNIPVRACCACLIFLNYSSWNEPTEGFWKEKHQKLTSGLDENTEKLSIHFPRENGRASLEFGGGPSVVRGV